MKCGRLSIILMLIPSISWANTLTLAEIFSSVKAHFPLIIASQQEVNKANAKMEGSKGAFDPIISSSVQASPAGTYINRYVDVGVHVPIMQYGAQAFVDYRNGQGDYPSYDQNYLTTQVGEVRAGVNFPLMRNKVIDPQRAMLKENQFQVALQKSRLLLTMINTLQMASYAYWDWIAQGIKVHVSEQLLDLAEIRQQAILIRHKVGDAAQVDITENERLIIQRRAALLMQKQQLQQAALTLSLYYRDANGNPIVPQNAWLPKQFPSNKAFTNKQRLAAYCYAFINQHPAIKMLNLEQHISFVNMQLQQNNALPTLDGQLYVAKDYGSNNNNNVRIWQSAVYFSLNFNLPIYRRQALNGVIEAKRQIDQINSEKQLTKDKLTVAIANLINQSDAQQQQLNLLKHEVELAQTVEDAEKLRFTHGESSIFLVNQRETSTFETQNVLVNANNNLLRTKTDIAAACGFQSECVALLGASFKHAVL